MTLSSSLEENYPLISREGSFVPSSVGLGTNEMPSFLNLSPNETMSGGYDEYFVPPLESRYECPICLLALREPVQTSCGHRFCKSCILRLIRDGDSKCPVDEEHLSESEIYPDNFAKREMMEFEVFCRATKQHGCTWKGPLKKLQDHLNECPLVPVTCANSCGKEIQRKDLQQHMATECDLRKIPCDYCQNDVSWNDTEKHFETCFKYPEKCDKCEEEGIERDKMEFHLERHCPKVKIKCPFNKAGCTFEGLRYDVEKHNKEQFSNHMEELVKMFDSLKSVVDEMEVQIRNESLPKGQACTNELSIRTEQKEQQQQIDEIMNTIDSLTKVVHRLERQQDEMRKRQEKLLQEMNFRLLQCGRRFCNGTFIWKIENYLQCCSEAISGAKTRLYSPSFYTSPFGYKLCMRINLNGVGNGEGKHVALYVHIVQGDFDDNLDWPFTGKFALSILDQSDNKECRRHIRKSIKAAEPNLNAFQRPTAPYNSLGFGFEEFASVNQMCEPQYVKNNTLLVKFKIIG